MFGCGFEQRVGLDYNKTFALVVKWETLCLIVKIASHKHWPILHLDVQTTFLNDFLSKEVHMEQLVGFVEHRIEHKVCFFYVPYTIQSRAFMPSTVASLNFCDKEIFSKMLKI